MAESKVIIPLLFINPADFRSSANMALCSDLLRVLQQTFDSLLPKLHICNYSKNFIPDKPAFNSYHFTVTFCQAP